MINVDAWVWLGTVLVENRNSVARDSEVHGSNRGSGRNSGTDKVIPGSEPFLPETELGRSGDLARLLSPCRSERLSDCYSSRRI